MSITKKDQPKLKFPKEKKPFGSVAQKMEPLTAKLSEKLAL
jgi:hypothetical protein